MIHSAPLKVVRLKKHYRTRSGGYLEAVRDVSFEIQRGECFGLLGPNGAGKSTVIQCISGFYPATSGEVFIDDFNVYEKPKLARQALGVCAQEDTLDTDFRVFDQLVRFATFFRIPSSEAKNRAQDLLRRFGLEDKASEPVETLSGGMKRRLQVARALISDPKVIILDEPTTGLDPQVRRVLWDILMEERKKGVAILLSTHYMEEAERLCDRIGIIAKGQILDVDSPQNLIKRHMGETWIEEEIRPTVIWKRPPHLEDVYLKLTGRKLTHEDSHET